MQVFRRSFITRTRLLKTALVTSLLAVTLPGTFVAAQPVSCRMVPNQGNQCVAASDVNALIYNDLFNPNQSIGLSKVFTPNEAVARLDACLRRNGLGGWWGVTVGTPDQRRIFCKCNKEITNTPDIACDGAVYRHGDGFPDDGCQKMKETLAAGGLAILNFCLTGPLAALGHAVTLVDINCDGSADDRTISYIDSNNLAGGITTSPINEDGQLTSPPSIWSDGVRYDFKWLCGFVTKSPVESSVVDPVSNAD